MKIYLLILFACLLMITASARLSAETVKPENVEAELVSEVESIQAGQPFWVALRLKMEEHWHTYWQNPGDSGLATKIKWDLPEGFRADPIQWPYPEKIEAPPLVSFGYSGEVFLLVKIYPSTSLPDGKPVTLAAKADWLECKEICLPGSAQLKIRLPVKNEIPKIDGKWAGKFAESRAKLPLSTSDWRLSAAAKDDHIIIRATPPQDYKGDLSNVIFFPIQSGLINYAAEQKLNKASEGYVIELERSEFSTEPPTQIQGVLFSPQGWRGANSELALTVDVRVSQPVAAPAIQSSALTSLWIALLFSFIGGLILNLMPCVLPVLSIKVLDFVKQADKERAKVWQHGLVFTTGVLVSFWILAGALIALRAGGEQLGWGFQLQSPPFLIILASLLFLFGLNLFGVFEMGTSLMALGGKGSGRSGWVSSFLSGALATIVATPCTAPFMGSALGFALTQPIWASMLIFTSLGLGMATPYLLLSFAPSLLLYVPKAGLWMESFKQFMGFLLMATVVWLAWVLGIQAGINGVTGLLIALVLIGMGAWIQGRWGSVINSRRARIIAHIVVVILVSCGLALAMSGAKMGAGKGTITHDNTGGIDWQPFSPERVEELRAAGKPVFIDFTAAWCLSCQVNERVAFSSEDVQKEFSRLGIVALKADWTSRDETITRALAQFGRNGVPLYVLYGQKSGEPPTILPEIITPGIVLQELKKLK
jgi:thiol:disulfide interchange protein